MGTFKEASSNVNFAQIEHDVLKHWQETNAFKEQLRRSEGKPAYTFYDGPPFATGLPHYGHLLTGTIKDIVTRYASQTGHYVERRFGWDCHGLPVEREIDKKFNISSREDVMKMGIANYNEECRAIVMRYSSEWESTVNRMGRWIDFENGYKTMDKTFMETTWWVFKQMWDKGLVYRAFKVMPYSMACNTPLSNFELTLGYKEGVVDPSVVVSFPIRGEETTRILAWTTTPWTLPSNLALCVREDFEYVKFRLEGPIEIQNAPANSEVLYVCSADRLEWVLTELRNGFHGSKADKAAIKATVVSKVTGKDLVGLRYVPLFDYFNQPGTYTHENSFRVVADNYVTSTSGTGIVHQAPAFGEDDYRVCTTQKIVSIKPSGEGLPCPIDSNGCYTEEIPEHKGVNVKDADDAIKRRLKDNGRLVVNSTITHTYPYCWRSNTPLIYKAIPAWFIKVEDIRDRLVANNKTTSWVPDFVREGRFHNWLEGATDWCISRNRYWGTPLPIWTNEDFTEIKIMGSIGELEAATGKKYDDIHRHFIDQDDIISPDTGNVLKRVDEVFDCWFESGSMPYGQLHYPFENVDKFQKGFPADFVAEGLDQTRGWFYTLMVVGTALFDQAPFKNLIVNGLVLAADGKKMSKSLRNYPDPNEIIEEHGADAVRMYLVNSPVVHADNLKFQAEGVKAVVRDCFLPLYNSYRFLLQEVGRFESVEGTNWTPDFNAAHTSTNPTDKWIIASTHNLIAFFHREMKAYRLYTVVPRLLSYLDDLTNWYIRLNRDRMRGSEGREEAIRSLSTLYEVVFTLTHLFSPFCPFLSESLYQNLKLALPESERMDSVHFLDLPLADPNLLDEKAEAHFNNMKRVVEVGRAIREQRKVGLKTPLAGMKICHPDQEFIESVKALESYVSEQLNIVGPITYSSDAADVSFTALPNNQKLGKALGKVFATVNKEVRALDSAAIAAFNKEVAANPNHKITLSEATGNVELGSDDLIIRLDPKADRLGKDSLIGAHSDQVVVVELDFTPDVSLTQMAITRETVNLIQKQRKSGGLNPEDDITIRVLTDDEETSAALQAQREYATKLLRRPFFSATLAQGASDDFAAAENAGALIIDAQVDINEEAGVKATVRIYKRN